jgi:hypothetical protein
MDLAGLTPTLVAEVWHPIQLSPSGPSSRRGFRSHSFAIAQCELAAIASNLGGVACVGRRNLPSDTIPPDENFLEAVSKLLSTQQIEGDTYKFIMTQTGGTRKKAKAAVRVLRKRGIAIPTQERPSKPAAQSESKEIGE